MINQKEVLLKIIDAAGRKLISAENQLTELDSMGDADCGAGVRRGFEAVINSSGELSGLETGDILRKVGFTLAYTIGGTSGAMLGTGFIEAGKSLADSKEPTALEWISASRQALEVIKRRGGNTRIGDKTLVDALEPAVAAMQAVYDSFFKGGQEKNLASGDAGNIAKILVEAGYMAAVLGSDKTIDMVAKKGRASYVGERSRGNRDPGSVIIVLIFEAALEVLKTLYI